MQQKSEKLWHIKSRVIYHIDFLLKLKNIDIFPRSLKILKSMLDDLTSHKFWGKIISFPLTL